MPTENENNNRYTISSIKKNCDKFCSFCFPEMADVLSHGQFPDDKTVKVSVGELLTVKGIWHTNNFSL